MGLEFPVVDLLILGGRLNLLGRELDFAAARLYTRAVGTTPRTVAVTLEMRIRGIVGNEEIGLFSDIVQVTVM